MLRRVSLTAVVLCLIVTPALFAHAAAEKSQQEPKLIPQLEKLKPGSRIVSHDFDMRDVTPDKVVEIEADGSTHQIYLWTTPLKKVQP